VERTCYPIETSAAHTCRPTPIRFHVGEVKSILVKVFNTKLLASARRLR
jgi:hypothetical protein